ncbi:hypothetical protein O6H91_23G009800 [Diphasiastrum complanatum]|uniref:Uncharacterized protein n=1 Tax=Diphasiastrum complanatum TaxID=34168 RepID=A0ACC2A9R1_DIPCM|nr:hypothetical protein O6H91_23G009800 [Diphasiastrum complanatum]
MSGTPVAAILQDVAKPSIYLQKPGERPPYLVDANNASTGVQVGELPSSEDEIAIKVRKPYTITKHREKWTDEEHRRFLEALKLYGRGWRLIEEHIGTKSAIQIRSHAQKFFSKLEREQSTTGGNPTDTAQDIDIPPPRPKRKPNHPYPRKAPTLTATTRNCSAAASATLPSKTSTHRFVAANYFQTAACAPLQVHSARKESDQMQTGELISSHTSSSAGLKIFGQTLAPAIHSSSDSDEAVPAFNVGSVNEMAAMEACVKARQRMLLLSESINSMHAFDGLATRKSQRTTIEPSCAADASQRKVLAVEALSIHNMYEACDSAREQKISEENLRDQKLASEVNAKTFGDDFLFKMEEEIQVKEGKCHFPKTPNLKLSDGSCHQRNKIFSSTDVSSTCNASSDLDCGDNSQKMAKIHEELTLQHNDSAKAAAMQSLLMMHGRHSILPIDPASFAATFTGGFHNMSKSSEHPIFHNVHNLAYVPGLATADPFILHLAQAAAHCDSAAFTSSSGTSKTVSSSQVPVGNCKDDKESETMDAARAAAVATLAAASAWWALQGAMASGHPNRHWFTLNAPHMAAVDSTATAAFRVSKEANRSSAANTRNFVPDIIPTGSGQNDRKIPMSCTTSDRDGRKRVRGNFGTEFSNEGKCFDKELEQCHNQGLSSMSECNQTACRVDPGLTHEHPLSNLCACAHCRKQVNSFSSHEEHGLIKQKKRLKKTSEEPIHSEVATKSTSSSETGSQHHLLSQKTHKKKSLQTSNELPGKDEHQQSQSRVVPRAPVAHLDGRENGRQGSSSCTASFLEESEVQRDSLRINREEDLPCARSGSQLEEPGLVTEIEEGDMRACQEARDRTASPDSVLNIGEVFNKQKHFASNSSQGSSSPSWKQTGFNGLGFLPYRRPSGRTSASHCI